MKRFACVSLFLVALGVCFLPHRVAAATLTNSYPRLANYYLTRTLGATEISELARWDIVILGVDNQYNNPKVFAQLRAKNPRIIILAYILSEEFPGGYDGMTDANQPVVKLRSGIAGSWWLKGPSGQKTGFWPGANMLNVTNYAPLVNGMRWNTYLPKFVSEQVLSTGLWDGVFYDNVFNDVSWVNGGNIDVNNDGVKDSASMADEAWRTGMRVIMSRTRELVGNDMIILGNGGGQYYPEMNGRLIEEFPSDLDGGWSGAMQKYADVMSRGLFPSVVIVNGKSSTGLPTDYRTMRYVLASTLMNGGFFSYDQGSVQHMALWKYDEFEAYLGSPLGTAKRVTGNTTSSYVAGAWRRDFQNGIVLVNSTNSPVTIKLGDGYEELRGTQSNVNSGRIITEITLAGHDGRILLKRQATIDNGAYTNGALVKLFKLNGSQTRNGFFSYTKNQSGGVPIVVKDVNNDGFAETVVGAGGRVAIYNHLAQKIYSWQPFRNYSGNLSMAAADVNGDGVMEIIVAPQGGTNQRIAGFNLAGKLVVKPFRPFKYDYPAGISVAAADCNGDGKIEIVAGAGKKADPRVSVFNVAGRRLSTWLAYGKSFRGGVRVAAGDLDGDGKAEIVTAPGPTGGPHIRIFRMSGKLAAPGFFALAKSYRQGLYVSVDDIDHIGENRIIISVPVTY